MAENFKARLKKYESGWKESKGSQERTFSRPPDGKHKMVLTSAQVGESKQGRLQVTWDFRITKGKAINQHCFQWDGLEDDRGWAMIKGRLAAMGVKAPRRIIDLSESLDKACDRKIYGEISTRKGGGDFYDLQILKRLKKKKAKEEDTDEGLDD